MALSTQEIRFGFRLQGKSTHPHCLWCLERDPTNQHPIVNECALEHWQIFSVHILAHVMSRTY